MSIDTKNVNCIIYRYLDSDAVIQTLQPDRVRLRFSRISNFSDKSEGLYARTYLTEIKNSILRLQKYNSKKIDTVFEMISNADLPDAFIYSMTRNADSDYMYENFVPRNESKFCICFDKKAIEEHLATQGNDYSISDVHYGSDGTDYLSGFLLASLEADDNPEDILNRYMTRRFFIKDQFYSKENEVRITNLNCHGSSDYMLFDFPADIVSGIKAHPKNFKVDNDTLLSIIIDRNYRFIR